MKKLLLSIIISIIWITWFSLAADSCDQTFYGTLRYYKWYIFHDTFNNPWPSSYFLRNYKVEYKEQYNYNNSPDFPWFWRTDAIKTANYEVKKNENIKVIEAKNPYYVYAVPLIRTKDNLLLKYTLTYSSDIGWKTKKEHTECKYYEISRCWDGVLDTTENEICDNWKNNSNTIPGACNLACSWFVPQNPVPTCVLSINTWSINSGWSATLSRNISWTADLPTNIISSPTIYSFPHSVTNNAWTKIFSVNKTWYYNFSMTVKNAKWQNTCSANLNVTAPASKKVDLSLTKDVNKSVVASWDDIIFTITVRNDWPDTATNVEVTDLLPNWYIYIISNTPQWTYNSSNWIRTIWTINKWESKSMTIKAKVKNSWNYLNIAEVTKCTEEDIDSTPNNHISTEDDQDDAIVTLGQEFTELDIEKTLIRDVPYQSWELVWFRITFVNKWPLVAHHVVISDFVPRWMNYVSSVIVMDDWSIIPLYEKTIENGIEVVRYKGFDLNINKWWYIILTWTSKWVEFINETTNIVEIRADEWYDKSRAKFTIYSPTTVLTIDKTINKSIFNLWETVNFSIAVKNNWPTTISWLTIQDIRPDTSCIIPSATWTSDHALTMTNPNNPYTRTYNQTLNIWETINLYLNWQVKNDVNCVRNYLNTWTLTYSILWQQKFLRDVVPFSVISGTWGEVSCRSISVDKSIIQLDSNDNWSTVVTCNTNWWTGNIKIDCGNWTSYSMSNVTSLFYTCEYHETSTPKDRTISCEVNNVSNSNCKQDILLDEKPDRWWYCGNWKLDWFESCDITKAKRAYNGWDKYNGYYIIWDRADNGHNEISSKYDDWQYYCKNCGIKELPWSEVYTPPACFNTNTTISVQKWEYLPFRWNLENVDEIIDEDDCDSSNDGKILKDSLKCTFKIYNGKNSDSDEDEVYKITKDCDVDERDGNKLFDYFENSNIYRSLDNAFWKYYLKVNDFTKDVYGEYKLALDSVNYEYCDWDNGKKWTVVERVCEVDFAVTKPYIAQKNNFNIMPKATNLKLKDFYDIFGNELIKKTDLDKIMILDEWQYNASSNVYSLMTSFIKKYEKLAIKIDRSLVSNMIESNSSVQVSKVPNQQIYIFQWKWELKLKELANTSKPFTMIIKWLNLIVKWNIDKTNWMFLVDWWTISFEESDTNRCKKSQTVQWIFISNKWFAANNSNIYQKTANDDLDNPRCVYGWLKVKWVLIGNNIESVIMARRSQLNDWFRVNSTSESAIKIERRNEIFNWASVLIEYSPALREQLPPGANEFTKSLEIYKK